MSDVNEGAEPIGYVEQDPPAVEDPNSLIKNLKSEFNRKNNSVKDQVARQSEMINQILQRLDQQSSPKEEAPDIYTEPEKYADYVASKAVSKVNTTTSQGQSAQPQLDNSVKEAYMEMTERFPELKDQGSNLYKRANEIYLDTGQSAYALRAAVFEAAGELPRTGAGSGMDEDFTVSQTKSPQKRQPTKKSKVNSGIETVARAFNLDVEDPDVRDLLEASAEREDWINDVASDLGRFDRMIKKKGRSQRQGEG